MLRALGRSSEETDASIRFSFGRFTTDAEIELAAVLVLEALERSLGDRNPVRNDDLVR